MIRNLVPGHEVSPEQFLWYRRSHPEEHPLCRWTCPYFTAIGSVTPNARAQAKGWLFAIDAGTGEVRWRQHWLAPLVANITATSGGMLFTGDLDNNFLARDA